MQFFKGLRFFMLILVNKSLHFSKNLKHQILKFKLIGLLEWPKLAQILKRERDFKFN